MNSTTGTFGILPHHVPSIAVLQPGLITVYETDKTQKYFGKYPPPHPALPLSVICVCISASSGTVTINADSTVQILAEAAYPLDMLDPQVYTYIHNHFHQFKLYCIMLTGSKTRT